MLIVLANDHYLMIVQRQQGDHFDYADDGVVINDDVMIDAVNDVVMMKMMMLMMQRMDVDYDNQLHAVIRALYNFE